VPDIEFLGDSIPQLAFLEDVDDTHLNIRILACESRRGSIAATFTVVVPQVKGGAGR